MRSIAFSLLFALALLAPPAQACSPTTSSAVNACAGEGTCVYVVNDLCQPGCLVSVHVYQESNGRSGLQRDDSQRDDTCNGIYPADRALV